MFFCNLFILWSRSTWACELKCCHKILTARQAQCHAPRERVSWNDNEVIENSIVNRHAPRERVSWNLIKNRLYLLIDKVTLHVSVWVEIVDFTDIKSIFSVTLHVSVWVEIKVAFYFLLTHWSRSTWACELKCKIISTGVDFNGHAPRERVSWNDRDKKPCDIGYSHAPRERVSWNLLNGF